MCARSSRDSVTLGSMPPKSQRQVAAAKVKAEEEEPEKSFPAIVRLFLGCALNFGLFDCSIVGLCRCLKLTQFQVLADTFETKFQPFTLEKPRVCFPQLPFIISEAWGPYDSRAGSMRARRLADSYGGIVSFTPWECSSYRIYARVFSKCRYR